jgi:hypothetical protein
MLGNSGSGLGRQDVGRGFGVTWLSQATLFAGSEDFAEEKRYTA